MSVLSIDTTVICERDIHTGKPQDAPRREVIYSYIGHVLEVVNRYKWLDIYGEESMRAYMHKARIDMAPHVFATAE
ncbi:hypothetical protein PsorP6_001151 [Peronosclerospora sorghi]|uniref:Uncharacterized protein n=1 Tax=Peronosclerospora sorghi TaxID=230839 RepID=A0ACC0WVW8_9STRA|nr:hypothetical protein PsorP6_001151 [Peronosclerospora sorghi]